MDFLTFARKQWDRVAAWAAIAVGALLLLLGWLGASDTVYPAEQIPYVISGGLGGLCLVGIGAMLWISADLRDEWSELRELAGRLGVSEPDAGAGAGEGDVAGPAAAAAPAASANGAAPPVGAPRQ